MWIRQPEGDAAVVFVHGLLANESSGWRHDNGTFWPDLLDQEPQVADLGIYVYSYPTHLFSARFQLADISQDLKLRFFTFDKLARCRKLVFVCHGFGGIIVRKFLVEHADELAKRRIEIGLFLLASPAAGSAYGDWLAPLARFLGESPAEAWRFVQDHRWLHTLDDDFQTIQETGRLRLVGKELIEDHFVELRRLWFKHRVKPISGRRYFGRPGKVAGSDHFSIARPANADAMQHRSLLTFVAGLVAETAVEAVAVATP